MKICLVYQSNYPWDVRVEKISKSITNKGHDVYILCRNTANKKRKEQLDGLNIRRLRYIKILRDIGNKIISAPFYFNIFWLYYIIKCVNEEKCDTIIVRDLPLLLMGVIASIILRKKIIYDMAECYPNMYKSMLKFEDKKLFNFFIKNHILASAIERICINLSDNIISMIEESRERLISKKVNKDKILIIRNVPSKYSFPGLQREYNQKKKLKLLYVGFITKLRGIDLAIEGIRYYCKCCNNSTDIEFNIIGKGTAMDYIISLIDKYNLNEIVKLHGWCDFEKVKKYYNLSDIGILTYPQCEHWNSTIPNKLFDYMAMGMPIIASDVIPIKRIISEVNCGLTYDAYDFKKFAEILNIMKDSKARKQFGTNGYIAIQTKYNWEHDIDKLWNIIR